MRGSLGFLLLAALCFLASALSWLCRAYLKVLLQFDLFSDSKLSSLVSDLLMQGRRGILGIALTGFSSMALGFIAMIQLMPSLF